MRIKLPNVSRLAAIIVFVVATSIASYGQSLLPGNFEVTRVKPL